MARIALLLCSLGLLVTPALAADRPNILWITSEDNGPHLGCYGDAYAVTPNLDALAGKGMRYRRAWSTAPVCAPARTTIITGVYPTSTGSHQMRSAVPIPEWMKLYPEFLREVGYYCTNNSKEDYNLTGIGKIWDESSRSAHWKNRAAGQPFFAIFNFTISHESQIRNDIPEANRIHDPKKVQVPAYHPEAPEVRKDWAQYYDRLTMMDAQAGQVLKELEAAGLADDTIIFYYGDHGSGMPRSKRWPYNSGLQVPMIVHFPEKWRHLAPDEYEVGGESDRLVGFIDLAPTVLSLVGVEPPDWMQGHAFAGDYETKRPKYLHGFRGRMDERYDRVRSITDGRYVYLRQYMPHKIYGQHIDYMFQTPTTRVWKELYDQDALNAAQSRFWRTKSPEELYDLETDPDEVVNLADSPEHEEILERLRAAQRDHLLDTRDIDFLPEGEFHDRSRGSTPYDLAQDRDRYDLKRILKVAERASGLERDDTEDLIESLDDDDSAVRYWAVLGLLMREADGVQAALKPLRAALGDESPYVRIAAAEALGRYGTEEDLDPCLDVLLAEANIVEDGIYRAMPALNAISTLELRAAGRAASIAALPRQNPELPGKLGGYVPRLIEDILERLGEETR